MLLCADGHVKLGDFGLSRRFFDKHSRSESICGSPEYLNPEMALGHSHGRQVDFYGLGALLHELIVGLPPFYAKDKATLHKNIVSQELIFPKTMSQEASDLLTKLLTRDPEERLGAKRGAEEIKEHPFCKDIQWDQVL